MYCEGGGAIMRFFLPPGAGAGAVAGAFFSDGGSSKVGDMPPDMDLCAVAEYPELRVFIELTVSLRPSLGTSGCGAEWVPFVDVAACAVFCRSSFSFFFYSLVCSPGQSAGTFISHLLWQV